jgi:hypothetical protein
MGLGCREMGVFFAEHGSSEACEIPETPLLQDRSDNLSFI